MTRECRQFCTSVRSALTTITAQANVAPSKVVPVHRVAMPRHVWRWVQDLKFVVVSNRRSIRWNPRADVAIAVMYVLAECRGGVCRREALDSVGPVQAESRVPGPLHADFGELTSFVIPLANACTTTQSIPFLITRGDAKVSY
jgi:hypothetical protein